MRIERPEDFGHVALVMGGEGSERQVSLDGGRQVLDSLRRSGVNVTPADGISELLALIENDAVDRVFNILHGRGGEDGALQGALSCLGIPVTGSSLRGSAVSMDKDMSKSLWRQAGFLTADWVTLGRGQPADEAVRELGYPLVVKPVSEGSSVGISLVREAAALAPALTLAFDCEDRVMLETLIAGSEITVGILQGEALPAIRIETTREFYDYEAKYVDDQTRYLCPCGLPEADEAALGQVALTAFERVGASGWGRVDFLCDSEGRAYLLEANTTPGMTSHSLVPKAAAARGIEFEQLVWRILETSFEEKH